MLYLHADDLDEGRPVDRLPLFKDEQDRAGFEAGMNVDLSFVDHLIVVRRKVIHVHHINVRV